MAACVTILKRLAATSSEFCDCAVYPVYLVDYPTLKWYESTGRESTFQSTIYHPVYQSTR